MPSRSVELSGYRVTRHTTPAGVVLVALPLAHGDERLSIRRRS